MTATIRQGLELTLLPRRSEIGSYDWFNLEYNGVQVGKSRCRIDFDKLIVYSIMIYPEFEKQGYARAVIEYFQREHALIIADRVRYTARDFWSKLGFVPETEDSYVWRRPEIK